jgi:hypothetical protein
MAEPSGDPRGTCRRRRDLSLLRPGDRGHRPRRHVGRSGAGEGGRPDPAACLLPQPDRGGPAPGDWRRSRRSASARAPSPSSTWPIWASPKASRRTRPARATWPRRLPEVFIAASCSKNFGLYRERAGVVLIVTGEGAPRDAAAGTLSEFNRQNYTFPPDHGARVVETILNDPVLRDEWRDELRAMRLTMLGTAPRWPRRCGPRPGRTGSGISVRTGACSR